MAQDELGKTPQSWQDEPPLRRANGQFAPGHRQIGHRKKGVPNKTTRDVKEWLLSAAEAIGDGTGKGGGAAFVEKIGRERGEALLMGLLKLLPTVKSDEPPAPAPAPIVTINLLTIPSGEHLTAEAITSLRAATPQLVINNDEPDPAA